MTVRVGEIRLLGLRGHPAGGGHAVATPFAVGHAPGMMAITDARDSDYLVP